MLQIFKSIKEISAKNLELGALSLVIIDSVHLLEEENPIEHLEEIAADLNVTIIAIKGIEGSPADPCVCGAEVSSGVYARAGVCAECLHHQQLEHEMPQTRTRCTTIRLEPSEKHH